METVSLKFKTLMDKELYVQQTDKLLKKLKFYNEKIIQKKRLDIKVVCFEIKILFLQS